MSNTYKFYGCKRIKHTNENIETKIDKTITKILSFKHQSLNIFFPKKQDKNWIKTKTTIGIKNIIIENISSPKEYDPKILKLSSTCTALKLKTKYSKIKHKIKTIPANKIFFISHLLPF